MDIIEILQITVDEIVSIEYKSDECYPIFQVFDIGEEIVITCIYLDSQIGEVLFPAEKNGYGHDNLRNIIERLYNRTM